MPLDLSIPDSQISLLRKTYEAAYYELRERIEPLLREMAEMEPVLVQLGIVESGQQFTQMNLLRLNVSSNDGSLNGYNPAWKWIQKIKYVLEVRRESMTSTEIIDEMLRLDPNESKARLTNSVPATLSAVVKTFGSDIKRKQNAKGEYEYWLDDLPF